MMRLISRLLRRRLIISLALLGTVFVVAVAQPRFALRAVEWCFPRILFHAKTQAPLIAVTFDDGPDPIYTPQMLEILARHDARATFFLIGEKARRHPELVRAIRAAGHEIGNHTDSHGGTVFASQRNFEVSLMRAESTLELREGKLLRPGGAWIRPAQLDYATQRGYVTVLGSAYAFDPQQPPARYIAWVISKNMEPGAIVVLHDAGGDRSRSVAALEPILAAAEKKDLRCVTVTELMARAK